MLTDATEGDIMITQTIDLLGLTKKEIEFCIKKYGEEYVASKVDIIINSASFKNGAIKNVAEYFKTALSKDFQVRQ